LSSGFFISIKQALSPGIYLISVIRSFFKIIIVGLGLLALVVHFTALLIYANPIEHSKVKIDYWSQAYVYPFFEQGWSLFVPAPTSNYKLYAEFENNGKQKADVFNEVVIQHQSNRLKGYGPLLLALSNSIHYFEKTTHAREALNGPITGDAYFHIVEHFVKNYVQYTRKVHLEKLKIILVVEDIVSKEKRIYFN
jgi:hypothetical protein